MKKTLFVVILAMAIMAVASTAFANGYESWSSVGSNAGSLTTPHKDYQLSTVKCAVCHAAHKADVNGEVLLKSKIADACTYCHITTNVGGKQIYNADAFAYNNGSGFDINNYAHNAVYGYTCSSCHSVHGAGTYDFTGYADVSSKILREYTTGEHVKFGGGAVPADYDEATAATRNMAVTNFCTQCHDTMFAADSQTEKDYGHSTPDLGYTHPMVRDASLAAFKPALKAGSTVAFNDQVAFVNSEACRSCHDAGLVNQGAGVITSSFPHYTPGAEQFLMGATQAGTAKTNASNGDFDGVCLKCHVANGGLSGVGQTY